MLSDLSIHGYHAATKNSSCPYRQPSSEWFATRSSPTSNSSAAIPATDLITTLPRMLKYSHEIPSLDFHGALIS
jgi:hypothetical protein